MNKNLEVRDRFTYVHVCSMVKSKLPILTSGLESCAVISFSSQNYNYMIHGSNTVLSNKLTNPDYSDILDEVISFLSYNPMIRPNQIHVTVSHEFDLSKLKDYLQIAIPEARVNVRNYYQYIKSYETTGMQLIGVDNDNFLSFNPLKEESHRKMLSQIRPDVMSYDMTVALEDLED